MDNNKPDGEDIIRAFEKLESQWFEWNEDINRFIGIADQTITYEDYSTFLNIVTEESDVITNCKGLAHVLTDVNDNDHTDCDGSSETVNNVNVEVNCDNACGDNTEGRDKGTLKVISMDESEAASNNMKEFAASNADVEYCKNTDTEHFISYNNIESSEEFNTSLDCFTISKDIDDISVNLNFKEQNHDDPIINTKLTIDDNVEEPNVVIIGQDIIDDEMKPSVEATNESTDMFINYQNKIPNLISHGDEGKICPANSNSDVEDDNDDCISLLDNEEEFFNDVYCYENEGNTSTENSHSIGKILRVEDDESLYSDLTNSNLSNRNERPNCDGSNLNKYSSEKQNTNFKYNRIECMGNVCVKNGSYDEVNVMETSNIECMNYLENGTKLDTSISENIAVGDNSDFYKDVTLVDMNNFYIDGKAGNESEEFGPFPLNVDRNNSYQKTPRTDDFTDSKKRKHMILFRNVCYFNLMNKCNRSCCTFPHVIPEVSKIKLELTIFNNKLLIEEYDLIKDNQIKFDYGLCFLEECSKRNLSREVIRMAIDFIKITNSQEKAAFQNTIVKTTLLHLNKAEVDECADLLTAEYFPGRRCLCDILLDAISVTEPFLDYKLAFIKLTDIIIPKAFSNKITKAILEQICKISHEPPLSRALLKIIKYTHPKIFQDPMIQTFEHMIKHDKELITEFVHLKSAIVGSNTIVDNWGTTNTPVTDNLRNMNMSSIKDSTNNEKNTFHESDQGSKINSEHVQKDALPHNSLPVPRQGPSNSEHVSSLNDIRRLSIVNRIIFMPKDALLRNPLPVTRHGPSIGEHVSCPNKNRRLSSDTGNIFIPKDALPRNPLPVTRHGPSIGEHVSCPINNRRLSSDTGNIFISKDALLRNPLPVTRHGPSIGEHVSCPNNNRRLSSDTGNIFIPKDSLTHNPLPVTRHGPSIGEHVSCPINNRRLSSDTGNIFIPKDALPRNPLPVTKQGPSNGKHVLSPNNSRELSSANTDIFVPKDPLPDNSLPGTSQQDPNYVNKCIKRKRSATKIHPWMSIKAKSHAGAKENQT